MRVRPALGCKLEISGIQRGIDSLPHRPRLALALGLERIGIERGLGVMVFDDELHGTPDVEIGDHHVTSQMP